MLSELGERKLFLRTGLAAVIALTGFLFMSALLPGGKAMAAVDHEEEYHTVDIHSDTESFMININPDAGEYGLMQYMTGEESAQIVWDKDSSTLTLNDLVWWLWSNGPEDRFFEVEDIDDLTIVLNGNNELHGMNFTSNGILINRVGGVLTITGDGQLDIESDSTEAAIAFHNFNPDRPDEHPYTKLKNTATIIAECTGENAEADVELRGTKLALVSNTGYIHGRIILDWYYFKDMVPYTTEHEIQVQHDYVAKAYYFMNTEVETGDPDMRWDPDWVALPNNIVGELVQREEGEVLRRAIGDPAVAYDDEGYPIPSNGYYQYFWVWNEEWGGSMEEENAPTVFMIYGEPETLDKLPGPADKVQVDDGKVHEFNTDLRNLAVGCGNVTVNGNIRYGLTGSSEVVWDGPPDPETGGIKLKRDDSGVPIVAFDSSESNIVVNGDVMCLNLSDTFKGNITLNGHSMFTTYAHELQSRDNVPRDEMAFPEDLYSAVANMGKVVENGEFVAGIEPFEGWINGAEYEGESYTQLMHDVDEQFVHGTQQIIDNTVISVDLGSEGISESAFPFVKAAGEDEIGKARKILGNETAGVFALEISLIDGTEKIQPDKTIDMYIDGVPNFNKPALYHIKADGTAEKVYIFDGTTFNGRIKAPVNSFSTYFVAEDTNIETSVAAKGLGLNESGIWCLLDDKGNIVKDYNGLYYDEELGWWLVQNGLVAFDYSDLYYDPSVGWWLVQSGAINFGYNDLYCSDNYGWWLVQNGSVTFEYNDLYYSDNYGWWLVQNGSVSFEYNDLYYSDNYGWWLVNGGAVDFEYSDLYSSHTYGWWLVQGGAVDFDYSDLYYSPGSGWWLVQNGKVALDYSDLYGSPNYGWWLVQGGTVNFGYSGIFASSTYGMWMVNSGYVDFQANGNGVSEQYGTYSVDNGAVTADRPYIIKGLSMGSDGVWYLYKNGKVDTSYTGLYYDKEYGWWLVKDGKVAFDYNDLYNDSEYGWWKITGGSVDFGYTGLYFSENYGWWLIGSGTVAFNYNDLWGDANYGWWKINQGSVDFNYNDLYESPTFGWWLITGGKVNFDYNGVFESPKYGTWTISGGTVQF